MAKNGRFDAALPVHAFHRLFLGSEEGGDRPAPLVPDTVAAVARPADPARELETALARGFNAMAAGPRAQPKKLRAARLLRSPVAASVKKTKSVSLTAALR